ncbi:MAG: PAS domain-containing sensor histidine kinase [Panacagrimonas sp.]
MQALSIDITSQVELHKQLGMLDNLIEQMGLAFVKGDREGRILRVNAAFAKLTGYRVDELLQMKTSDLTPEHWRNVDAERFRQMRVTGRGVHGEKEYRRKDGTVVPVGFYSEPYRNTNGEFEGLYAFVTDQTENKRKAAEVEQIQSALRESEERLRAAFECSAIGIILVEPNGHPIRANDAACHILGYTEQEFLSNDRERTTHPDDIGTEEVFRRQLLDGQIPSYTMERRQFHKDGHIVWARSTVSAARNSAGSLLHLIYEIEDITDRKQAEADLQAADEQNRKLELELRHAQKLEAVGRLASGVAHEINTPVQFVSDSCYFLRDGLADLQSLLGTYRESLERIAGGDIAPQAALDHAREAERALDVDYLLENLPSAAERSLQGLERVATIVRSMKEFAHPDRKDKANADLNQAILSTLTIARNEYKYVAEVETDLGELPPVCCLLSEFNQAILNLVVNAAHAIGDTVQGSDRRGLIRIRTRYEAPHAVISIEDNGAGIPESIRDKIFDPFFTTKEIGKGTGQGLAIVRSVVVNKHQGTIGVHSTPGQGTTFVLRLPAEAARPAQELAA